MGGSAPGQGGILREKMGKMKNKVREENSYLLDSNSSKKSRRESRNYLHPFQHILVYKTKASNSKNFSDLSPDAPQRTGKWISQISPHVSCRTSMSIPINPNKENTSNYGLIGKSVKNVTPNSASMNYQCQDMPMSSCSICPVHKVREYSLESTW